MSKIITIKLTSAGQNSGPYNIYDGNENIIDENVSLETLIAGISYEVADSVTMITIESIGDCKFRKTQTLAPVTQDEYRNAKYVQTYKACLWRHLTDTIHYNYFYGKIEPYIIEYPFSYNFQDEILQNVMDYTKVYEYIKSRDGVFDNTLKIQIDNKWFNKAILYNDQQSSGMLELMLRPMNNLSAYSAYPKFNEESKTILFSKSDNFYQYNTFWNVVKNPLLPLFKASCESLSIDKVLNQENMDYALRSFKKGSLRAKDLRIRHILDNSATTHLVSQFIIAPTQNSYK